MNRRSGLPNIRAKPKSASFSCPRGPINKLFGFISLRGEAIYVQYKRLGSEDFEEDLRNKKTYLCKTHFLWQKASPFKVIWRYDFMSAGERTIFLSRMTASRSVSMNSNTRCKFPLCGNASISSIILESFNSFSNLISLRAVKLTPSFCFPSRIFLIATVCPVCINQKLDPSIAFSLNKIKTTTPPLLTVYGSKRLLGWNQQVHNSWSLSITISERTNYNIQVQHSSVLWKHWVNHLSEAKIQPDITLKKNLEKWMSLINTSTDKTQVLIKFSLTQKTEANYAALDHQDREAAIP